MSNDGGAGRRCAGVAMLVGSSIATLITVNFLVVDGSLYLFWAGLAIVLGFLGVNRIRPPQPDPLIGWNLASARPVGIEMLPRGSEESGWALDSGSELRVRLAESEVEHPVRFLVDGAPLKPGENGSGHLVLRPGAPLDGLGVGKCLEIRDAEGETVGHATIQDSG